MRGNQQQIKICRSTDHQYGRQSNGKHEHESKNN